ncbi:MAG: hypothetical protein GF409_07645 [Candidatus Omnitrophica bacterium]|nr:hypothetical protein [Candidatus Omnitrophota bacterium]
MAERGLLKDLGLDPLSKAVSKRIRQLMTGQPGRRFTDYHERFGAKRPLKKAFMFISAGIFWLIALVLSVAPGPGFLFFLLGLAVIAAQLAPAARFLDLLESKIRK